MRRLALALGCLLVFAATAPAQTSIPRMFTYQGVLTAPNGNAEANGPYEVTIRLYATPTGGPALWEETHTITTVNGAFDVVMGRMVPLTLTFDRQYWLAVEIAQEGEMIPRTRLTAVPYALFADRARVADSLTATATGVVRSVNGVDGDLVLEGDGATTIMQTGKKFTISTPKSVQRIISLDGSILVRLTNESDIDLAIKAVDPSTILRAGAQPGEALVWDGVTSACKPKLITGDITDVMRRGDAAAGDLTGTYPNPLIREGAVTTEKIALGAVTRVQESVAKSLVSNGGGVGTSASHQMNGSLGQPVIGVVQRHPKHLEQGFWYAANRIHDANGWHTTVSMPDITGRNGQTITVPISMVSTQKMVVGGVKNWTARIRFNKLMLEPRGVTNLEEADKYYIVTLSGIATDTIQQLASLDVFVRLGNDTATALEFESFQWLEESRMRIYAESGSFTDLSICKAGGPRLTAVAGHPILRVTPQPVADKGEVICLFAQDEVVRVVIYDGAGTPVREIYSGPVAAGELHLPFTTMDLAAGAYVMSLRTEHHSVAEQFIIMR